MSVEVSNIHQLTDLMESVDESVVVSRRQGLEVHVWPQHAAPEVHYTKQPVLSMPTIPSSQSSLLSVEQRLSPLERLKSLTVATSLHFKADPTASFVPADTQRLRQLMALLHSHSAKLFRGKRLPELVLSLVSIPHDNHPGSGEPFICVRGLFLDDEISRFHVIVSPKTVRSYYAPLKLCYDKNEVTFASRPAGDTTYRLGTIGDRDTNSSTIMTTKSGDFDRDVERALVMQYAPDFPRSQNNSSPISSTIVRRLDMPILVAGNYCHLGKPRLWFGFTSSYIKKYESSLEAGPTYIDAGFQRVDLGISRGINLSCCRAVESRRSGQSSWIQKHVGFRGSHRATSIMLTVPDLRKGDAGSWVLDP